MKHLLFVSVVVVRPLLMEKFLFNSIFSNIFHANRVLSCPLFAGHLEELSNMC